MHRSTTASTYVDPYTPVPSGITVMAAYGENPPRHERKRVHEVNPYFPPTDKQEAATRRDRHRGSRVRLIQSDHTKLTSRQRMSTYSSNSQKSQQTSTNLTSDERYKNGSDEINRRRRHQKDEQQQAEDIKSSQGQVGTCIYEYDPETGSRWKCTPGMIDGPPTAAISEDVGNQTPAVCAEELDSQGNKRLHCKPAVTICTYEYSHHAGGSWKCKRILKRLTSTATVPHELSEKQTGSLQDGDIFSQQENETKEVSTKSNDVSEHLITPVYENSGAVEQHRDFNNTNNNYQGKHDNLNMLNVPEEVPMSVTMNLTSKGSKQEEINESNFNKDVLLIKQPHPLITAKGNSENQTNVTKEYQLSESNLALSSHSYGLRMGRGEPGRLAQEELDNADEDMFDEDYLHATTNIPMRNQERPKGGFEAILTAPRNESRNRKQLIAAQVPGHILLQNNSSYSYRPINSFEESNSSTQRSSLRILMHNLTGSLPLIPSTLTPNYKKDSLLTTTVIQQNEQRTYYPRLSSTDNFTTFASTMSEQSKTDGKEPTITSASNVRGQRGQKTLQKDTNHAEDKEEATMELGTNQEVNNPSESIVTITSVKQFVPSIQQSEMSNIKNNTAMKTVQQEIQNEKRPDNQTNKDAVLDIIPNNTTDLLDFSMDNLTTMESNVFVGTIGTTTEESYTETTFVYTETTFDSITDVPPTENTPTNFKVAKSRRATQTDDIADFPASRDRTFVAVLSPHKRYNTNENASNQNSDISRTMSEKSLNSMLNRGSRIGRKYFSHYSQQEELKQQIQQTYTRKSPMSNSTGAEKTRTPTDDTESLGEQAKTKQSTFNASSVANKHPSMVSPISRSHVRVKPLEGFREISSTLYRNSSAGSLYVDTSRTEDSNTYQDDLSITEPTTAPIAYQQKPASERYISEHIHNMHVPRSETTKNVSRVSLLLKALGNTQNKHQNMYSFNDSHQGNEQPENTVLEKNSTVTQTTPEAINVRPPIRAFVSQVQDGGMVKAWSVDEDSPESVIIYKTVVREDGTKVYQAIRVQHRRKSNFHTNKSNTTTNVRYIGKIESKNASYFENATNNQPLRSVRNHSLLDGNVLPTGYVSVSQNQQPHKLNLNNEDKSQPYEEPAVKQLNNNPSIPDFTNMRNTTNITQMTETPTHYRYSSGARPANEHPTSHNVTTSRPHAGRRFHSRGQYMQSESRLRQTFKNQNNRETTMEERPRGYSIPKASIVPTPHLTTPMTPDAIYTSKEMTGIPRLHDDYNVKITGFPSMLTTKQPKTFSTESLSTTKPVQSTITGVKEKNKGIGSLEHLTPTASSYDKTPGGRNVIGEITITYGGSDAQLGDVVNKSYIIRASERVIHHRNLALYDASSRRDTRIYGIPGDDINERYYYGQQEDPSLSVGPELTIEEIDKDATVPELTIKRLNNETLRLELTPDISDELCPFGCLGEKTTTDYTLGTSDTPYYETSRTTTKPQLLNITICDHNGKCTSPNMPNVLNNTDALELFLKRTPSTLNKSSHFSNKDYLNNGYSFVVSLKSRNQMGYNTAPPNRSSGYQNTLDKTQHLYGAEVDYSNLWSTVQTYTHYKELGPVPPTTVPKHSLSDNFNFKKHPLVRSAENDQKNDTQLSDDFDSSFTPSSKQIPVLQDAVPTSSEPISYYSALKKAITPLFHGYFITQKNEPLLTTPAYDYSYGTGNVGELRTNSQNLPVVQVNPSALLPSRIANYANSDDVMSKPTSRTYSVGDVYEHSKMPALYLSTPSTQREPIVRVYSKSTGRQETVTLSTPRRIRTTRLPPFTHKTTEAYDNLAQAKSTTFITEDRAPVETVSSLQAKQLPPTHTPTHTTGRLRRVIEDDTTTFSVAEFQPNTRGGGHRVFAPAPISQESKAVNNRRRSHNSQHFSSANHDYQHISNNRRANQGKYDSTFSPITSLRPRDNSKNQSQNDRRRSRTGSQNERRRTDYQNTTPFPTTKLMKSTQEATSLRQITFRTRSLANEERFRPPNAYNNRYSSLDYPSRQRSAYSSLFTTTSAPSIANAGRRNIQYYRDRITASKPGTISVRDKHRFRRPVINPEPSIDTIPIISTVTPPTELSSSSRAHRQTQTRGQRSRNWERRAREQFEVIIDSSSNARHGSRHISLDAATDP